MNRTLLLVLVLVGAIGMKHRSWAQNNCAQTLVDARTSFDNGHLYGIPAMLKPCLDNGFVKNERIQAFYLLTRTYLLIDDPISAEDSYLKLLKLDPEYKINEETDPIEIVLLSQKFKTTPIFEITYFKGGVNISTVSVINDYTTSGDGAKATYSSNVGFEFGMSAALNVTDNISLNADVLLARKSFTYSNRLFAQDGLTLQENQFWMELPVYVKYAKRFNKIYPYIFGGYSLQYMIASNAAPQLVNVEPTGETNAEFTVEGSGTNMIDRRKRFNQALIGGIGAKYRIKYRYVFAELKYTMGLRNVLSIDDQYGSNSELLFRYGYVDNDFKQNAVAFTVGYIHPIYKPRKKNARDHFIQRLFKKKGGDKE